MSSMFEQHKLRDNIAKTQIKVIEELNKSEETVRELLECNTIHQQEVAILKERIKTNEEELERFVFIYFNLVEFFTYRYVVEIIGVLLNHI